MGQKEAAHPVGTGAATARLPRGREAAAQPELQHQISARLRAIEPASTTWLQVAWGLPVALAAVGIRWLLDPWLEDQLLYVFPIAAVAIACRLGSWQAGLVCGAASLALANFVFVAPRLSLHLSRDDAIAALAVVVLMAVLIVLSHRVQKAARAIDVLALRLSASDAQKAQLLAVLAHEIRNPLSALRSATEVLRVGPPGADPARAVEIIGRQLDQVERLVCDLTDAALIQEGKIVLQHTRASVLTLVNTAVEGAQPALAARHQQVDVDVPAELHVWGDAVRLVQVISNLLQNAAKFSPPGSVIRLHAHAEADGVVLLVKDSGAGIPAERLEWIFDAYAQLRPAGGGMGLGLSLVRKLVLLHGGTVRALSRGPGEGSTFEVMLPTGDPL